MLEFVKYDCGCIGVAPDEEGNALITEVCDVNVGDYSPEPSICPFVSRPMGDKSFEPVSQEKTEEILDKIRGLFYDGRKFREVRSYLKDMKE